MDQHSLTALSERYPDLGSLVCVKSDVWVEVLGAEWVAHNPELPFFLAPDDVKWLNEQRGLDHGKLAAAVERVLSHELIFSDRSEPAELIKGAYRLMLAAYIEDLPAHVDMRLRGSMERLEEQVPAAILALNLWSQDPRTDEAAWFLWMMVGGAFLRAGDYPRATGYLQKAADLNPKSTEALNELGLCLAVKQQYGPAEELFKRALILAPDDFSALSHLGAVCLQRGRKNEALEYLARAAAQKPADEKVGKLLQLARVLKD